MLRIIIFLVPLIMGISLLSSHLEESEQKQDLITLEEAQTNKRTLKCLIKNAKSSNLITISPQKIQGFSKGTWHFTNGKAKSCQLI